MTAGRYPCGCWEWEHPADSSGIHAPDGLIDQLVTNEMRKAAAAASRRVRMGEVLRIRRARTEAYLAAKRRSAS